MTDKPKRAFVAVGKSQMNGEPMVDVSEARTPREAAVLAFHLNGFVDAAVDAVEVFELGRGRRYVRSVTAKPAGKAQ